MKVFITGGTGFIGRHLVRRMSQTGHTIRCLARKTSDTKELKDLGADIVTGDVNDRDSLREGIRGCDWVFNLANVYSLWEPDKTIYRKVNVEGTHNVMACALEAGVSKVVHVSTIGVWGKPEESPIREETPVATERESEYCRTKLSGEQIAWQFYREKGLPLVVIYPCAVIGSGDPKITGQTIKRLISHRLPARVFDDSISTFVHVRDVAEAILQAAEKKDNLGEKYIVGSTRLSMEDYWDLISDVSGVAPPLFRMPDSLVMFNARLLTWVADLIKRPPLWGMSIDGMRITKQGFIADGSKAERELGLVYTPIRTAIEEEVAWYRQTMPGYVPLRAMKTEADIPLYWSNQERRGQERSRVNFPCDVEGLSRGKQILQIAQVMNLSQNGMYLEAGTPLDEGSEIKAKITATSFNKSFWVMGRVLHSTARGMAVKFADFVPKEIEMITHPR